MDLSASTVMIEYEYTGGLPCNIRITSFQAQVTILVIYILYAYLLFYHVLKNATGMNICTATSYVCIRLKLTL